MSERLIGEVTKNSKEKILISLSEYEGHRYIDLRVHYEEEGTGEYKPTKKGIALSEKVLPQIVSKLQEGYMKLKSTKKA